MMICKWNDCQSIIHNNVLDHLGKHIGYPKSNTFVANCKWDGCELSKKTRGAMMSHVLVHIDVRPYKCECGKAFKRKYDRIVHCRKCKRQRSFNDPLKEIIAQVEQRENNKLYVRYLYSSQ